MPGPGPFFSLRWSVIAIRVISTLCLMITLTGLLQCGQRVENEASELKMASLKMIRVQCGQLPMLFWSSLSIVLFRGALLPTRYWITVDPFRLAIKASACKERFMCYSGPGLRYPRSWLINNRHYPGSTTSRTIERANLGVIHCRSPFRIIHGPL